MSKSGYALTTALVFGGQALWADVTPDDVWLSWQTIAQAQGQRLTSDSTKTDGDTLTLTGVTMTLMASLATALRHLTNCNCKIMATARLAFCCLTACRFTWPFPRTPPTANRPRLT